MKIAKLTKISKNPTKVYAKQRLFGFRNSD